MSFLKQLFGILFSIFIVIPLLSSIILYVVQERLLFPLPKVNNHLLQRARQSYPDSEIQLTTPDQVELHGWFVREPSLQKSPLLIYFGGNAEDVTGWLWNKNNFPMGSLLTVNYRSAGLSEGQPSEENLFKDALFLYDTFSAKESIDKTKIIVFGRSLGTGIAVYLASQRPVQGVILVSPFDSVKRIAQNKFFFVPIFLLLKHPFDSLARATSIEVPMLAILASEDTMIPPSHSVRLIQAWKGKVYQQIMIGADHNNVHEMKGYWDSIHEFIKLIEAIPPLYTLVRLNMRKETSKTTGEKSRIKSRTKKRKRPC
jgi:pimeloyl-ACP methyl ester carboxylesterase